MATIRDLCSSALQLCGAFSDIDPIPDRDLNYALGIYRSAIAGLNLSIDIPTHSKGTDAQFQTGQITYSVGATGDFVTAIVPQKLEGVKYLIGTAWVTLTEVSFQDYQSMQMLQNIATYPNIYTYQVLDSGVGELKIYPNPAQVLDARIVHQVELATQGINDVLTLPIGYEDAITYEMARLLCNAYGMTEKLGFITQEAQRRIALVRRKNHRANRLQNDAVQTMRGKYNIYSDTFVGGFN